MRLNEQEILDNLEVMMFRLGLGTYADKFPAYALLERYVNRMCTMTPMNQGELFILFKEAYGFAPRKILDVYMDFIATLPTDIEVSIAKKEDELYFEVEGETIAIEI
jgi:hypothetical protein